MSKMYAFSKLGEDLESGGTLYPGISLQDNELRWAFIRKVYSILSLQLLLTVVVAATVVLYSPLTLFIAGTPGLLLGISILPLILMCPLYCYHQKHPINLVLLGLFTVFLSLTVGVSCAFTKGRIVLEALILTAAVVFSLTGYTFWASKKGKDFSFLGPILFSSLLVLILFGFIQMVFPLGPLSTTIYGGVGAIIFSGYIVYDTDNLIKRFTYDQYVWASVVLYLDILNLFLTLLQLLRGNE
uniref:TSA: Wollemia nobilis Ref_Wollemi_Transcript_19177_1334 transcribed RNA sequence n=1 Tax=Wollemia nobilis TaxID=56998 RepID=A0A0C9RHZ3_9CONI